LREGIDLISKVKFGLDLGILTGIETNILFSLLYRIQNAHLSYVIRSSDLSYEKDISTEEQKIERLRSLILQETLTTLQITV
jgi:protein arginine kinase